MEKEKVRDIQKIKIDEVTLENVVNGNLEKQIPEFYELRAVIENNGWHNNETTFIHVVTVLKSLNEIIEKDEKLMKFLNEKIDECNRRDVLFLGTLFHDIAKKEALARSADRTSFPEHENIGAKKVISILDRFYLSNKEKEMIVGIIRNHGFFHMLRSSDLTEAKLQELKSNFPDIYKEICLLSYSDTKTSFLMETNPFEYEERISFYENIISKF